MIGVIVNVLAVALGGVLGTVFSKKLSTRFTTELNKVFGVCAIGMGISSVPLMQNMPAVTSLVAVPQAAVTHRFFRWRTSTFISQVICTQLQQPTTFAAQCLTTTFSRATHSALIREEFSSSVVLI